MFLAQNNIIVKLDRHNPVEYAILNPVAGNFDLMNEEEHRLYQEIESDPSAGGDDQPAKVQRDVDVEVNGKRFAVKLYVPADQVTAETPASWDTAALAPHLADGTTVTAARAGIGSLTGTDSLGSSSFSSGAPARVGSTSMASRIGREK